jgi:hypothetical protein
MLRRDCRVFKGGYGAIRPASSAVRFLVLVLDEDGVTLAPLPGFIYAP